VPRDKKRERNVADSVADKTDREAAYERESEEAKRNADAIERMNEQDRRRLEERRSHARGMSHPCRTEIP
jgi:hypothetical protein